MSSCNLDVVYDLVDWVNKVTQAEKDCVQYLKDTFTTPVDKALDVGTGASHFYKELHHTFRSIDGITVIDGEVDLANSFSDSNYNVTNVNKYDVESLSKVISTYNAIVDVNPKQHGCCQQHWEEYFDYILTQVVEGGVFLTHTMGFGQFKGLRTELLSLDELEIFFRRANMKMSLVPSPVIEKHFIVVASR